MKTKVKIKRIIYYSDQIKLKLTIMEFYLRKKELILVHLVLQKYHPLMNRLINNILFRKII